MELIWPHAKLRLVDVEFLEILIENLFRRLCFQIASRVEHLLGEILHINARKAARSSAAARSMAVHVGERYMSVSDTMAHEKARDLRLDLNAASR